MKTIIRTAVAVVALAVCSVSYGTPAEAGRCFKKASTGTNTTIKGAKFQAYEALLQSFDWGVWAAYMSTGSTPGYKVRPRYKCAKGGLGYSCKAVATICRTP
jgi:hypothetical protein